MKPALTLREISILDAEPGLTLAEPVMDGNGILLMSPDLVLTGPMIEALKKRQIEKITVVQSIPDEQQSALAEQALQRLGQLFRHCESAPANRRLSDVLRLYRTRILK